MKRFVIFLLLIMVGIIMIYIGRTFVTITRTQTRFDTSGYILNYSQEPEKLYFNENEKYRKSYDNKIIFNNTEGEQKVLDKEVFVHYSDGSVSSFCKGAIIDLNNLNSDPITYYNFSANKKLKSYSNGTYVAKNIDKELEFKNLIWKISNTKYLILSNDIKIVFSDEKKQTVKKYVEIEYIDNEIVKLFNNELLLETISSDVYLEIGEDLKINLGNKIVSQNNNNIISLESINVDPNDDVNIVNLDEFKDNEEEDEKQDNSENNIKNQSFIKDGSASSNAGDTINSGTQIVIGDNNEIINEPNSDENEINNSSIINNEGDTNYISVINENVNDSNDNTTNNNENNTVTNDNNNTETNTIGNDNQQNETNEIEDNKTNLEEEIDTIIETEIEDGLSFIMPGYKIKEFEVSSTGIKALIEIEDPEARLTSGTTTSIVNNMTGKVVYSLPETGATEIKIDISSLEPDTEYTLTMEATYSVEKESFRNYFIYKIFRTKNLGISLEKELFTSNSLSFNIEFDDDSEVTKLDVELVEAEKSYFDIENKNGSKNRIEFRDLQPDTEYTLQIKNIFVNKTTNGTTYSYKFKTLKEKPKFENGKTHENINVEIDKWNNQFILSIPNLLSGEIEYYEYQVYTMVQDQETIVYDKITNDSKLILKINEIIERNTAYNCRVLGSFYDNEKAVEYEIASTESSFIMNSSKMPTVRFETGGNGAVTFNSINGRLIIEDEGKTINYKKADIEIVYNSTTKGVDDSGSLFYETISEDLEIPININELKANETYAFSVYARYNLNDGNGERNGYIGSVNITTKAPIPMNATWETGNDGINVKMRLSSTENSSYEAESLYTFNLALYLGQEGASKDPIATAVITDQGVTSFAGTLKENYYDKSGLITKDTFNLTDSKLEEIQKENSFCTLVISDAKDYVSKNNEKKFENNLPILSGTYTYMISEFKDLNPSNPDDAIKYDSITKAKVDRTTYSKVIPSSNYSTVADITGNSYINGTTVIGVNLKANISNAKLVNYNYFEYFVYDKNKNLIATSGMIERGVEETSAPSALFLLDNGTEDENVDNGMNRGNTYYFKYYAYTNIFKENKFPYDEEGADYWNKYYMPSLSFSKQEPVIIMYPSVSDNDSITYKYKINDIDKSIQTLNNTRYFYTFYAGMEVNTDDLQEANIVENVDNNGFWTVKFDNMSQLIKKYYFEVKVKYNTEKGAQLVYKNLVKQKVEEIIPNIEITSEISEETGICKTIKFNNITNTHIERISNIKIILTDRNNINSDIVIEKNIDELINLNWEVKLDYISIINEKKYETLKDKTYDIMIEIYFYDGVSGYDVESEYIGYQTLDGNWLKIYNNMDFIRVKQNARGYASVYDGHRYIFNRDKVSIYKNDTEIAWLNYSEKGLTRKISTQDNVPIFPMKINKISDISTDYISFESVYPGIKSEKDLKISAGPTDVLIEVDNIYYKDTIFDPENNNIYAEIYKKADNSYINSVQIMADGTKISDLTNKENYYFYLYFIKDNIKYYFYDLTYQEYNHKYDFATLGRIELSNFNSEFIKETTNDGYVLFNHDSDHKTGQYIIKYEIFKDDLLITDDIFYGINKNEHKRALNGYFYVDVGEFSQNEAQFGTIWIEANRGSFFEFNTEYKFKATPVIINTDGEYEEIGNSIYTTLTYEPIKPQLTVYAKRIENESEDSGQIRWSISTSDESKIIKDNMIHYTIIDTTSNTTIIENNQTTLNNYRVITINTEKIQDEYEIIITYEYYLSNINDSNTKSKRIVKTLKSISTGVDLGKTSCIIRDDNNIEIKFYDSYNLANVNSIKGSIYDIEGKLLGTISLNENIQIYDNTNDEADPHKSIVLESNYVFNNGTAYMFALSFLDQAGNEIKYYEPESPVVK